MTASRLVRLLSVSGGAASVRRISPSHQLVLAACLLVGSSLLSASCAGDDVTLGGREPEVVASSGAAPSTPVGEGGSGDTVAVAGSSGSEPQARTLSVQDVAAVDEVNSDGKEDNVTLTGDMLELCFTSERDGGTGDVDVYCATRSSVDEPFAAPEEVLAVSTPGFESSAALSLDGLSLWVGSDRDGGLGLLDIWRSDRVDRQSEWQDPIAEVALNSTDDDIPRPVGFGNTIMPLGSRRTEGIYWTYFAPRSTDGEFLEPVLVEELAEDNRVLVDGFLSEDGLLLVYTLGTVSDGSDIYQSTRLSTADPFGPPEPVPGLNSSSDDRDPWLSPDGATFYFVSNRDGDFDIYSASATIE